MAIHRRHPTHSSRIGPDIAATKNGVQKRIDVVWSSCSQRSARKFKMVEPTSRIERNPCNQGRRVIISAGLENGLAISKASAKLLT